MFLLWPRRYVHAFASRRNPQILRVRALHGARSNTPFNILFLGRDDFSVLVLERLYRHRNIWNGIWVATHPDEKTGRRGSKLSVSPLKVKSYELGLQTSFIPPKREFKDWFPPSPFSLPTPSTNNLIITASFGRLIPDRLLHLFPVARRLNVHPSLVPLYRGPAPIQHALADGLEKTGVSILEMKEKRFGADGGEVWASKPVLIPPKSSFASLRDTLGVEGGELLVSVLKDMLSGTPIAMPQDDTKATRAPFITHDTATVDFCTWDACKVERMHRAVAHQKPITTNLPSSKTLQLHEPEPFVRGSPHSDLPKPMKALKMPGDATFDPTTRSLVIRCAKESYVLVPSVKQQDKNLLAAKEWWNGVRPEWLEGGVLRLGAMGRTTQSE